MRGAHKIPTGDWAEHESLTDVTEIFLRLEDLQSAPHIPVPNISAPYIPVPNISAPYIPAPYIPEPLPSARFDMPSLAAFPTGSSPNVRISSRLGAPDATHRVTRYSRTRTPLLAIGVIGAAVLGIGIGIVVAFSGGTAAAPARVAPAAITVTPIQTRAVGLTVTPIETPAPVH
ncbi:MAG: hypothetical protein ABI591_09965 [Kofleriaceae bacterium]